MDDTGLPWYRRDMRSWLPAWLPVWLFCSLMFSLVAVLIAGLGFDYDNRTEQIKSIALVALGAFAIAILLFEAFHHSARRGAGDSKQLPRAPIWLAAPLMTALFMMIPAQAIVHRHFSWGRRRRRVIIDGDRAEMVGWLFIAVALVFIGWLFSHKKRSRSVRIAGAISFLVVLVSTSIIILSSR